MTPHAPIHPKWPEATLGTVRCRQCGCVLTAPAKYDLCPNCYEAMIGAGAVLNRHTAATDSGQNDEAH